MWNNSIALGVVFLLVACGGEVEQESTSDVCNSVCTQEQGVCHSWEIQYNETCIGSTDKVLCCGFEPNHALTDCIVDSCREVPSIQCNGCNDASGVCLEGTAQDACGTNGSACVVCTATCEDNHEGCGPTMGYWSNTVCSQGMCVADEHQRSCCGQLKCDEVEHPPGC